MAIHNISETNYNKTESLGCIIFTGDGSCLFVKQNFYCADFKPKEINEE